MISIYDACHGTRPHPCVLRSNLQAIKACGSIYNGDCYVDESFMRLKTCIKPGISMLFRTLDVSQEGEHLHDAVMCSVDLVMDVAKKCFDFTEDEWMLQNETNEDKEKRVIDGLACILHTFGSALKECYAFQNQHTHITDEF